MSTPPASLPSASIPLNLPLLPSATVNISISEFMSLGGLYPLVFGMTLPAPVGAPPPITMNFAPAPALDEKCPTLTLSGPGDNANIVIKSDIPVQIVFTLMDTNYVMLGVAWGSTTPPYTAGRTTFPLIVIGRVPNNQGTIMAVIDNPQTAGGKSQNYGYVILVQKVATGEIGLIDPQMTNESEDPL